MVVGRIGITNCSRVIRNAWHSYYALLLVVKLVCGDFGIALPYTLIGYYVVGEKS
ncbi:DUF3265 domain-containing protein [Vibrio lentus]|nr:DUF3265 domain-containing protein [Vibrio lentus]MCC4795221.1 DUF3265 domain-containing protein [Vibrio lentus]MCC4853268.1 DUF3265 domain-containing protein [Vibrio lentus]